MKGIIYREWCGFGNHMETKTPSTLLSELWLGLVEPCYKLKRSFLPTSNYNLEFSREI